MEALYSLGVKEYHIMGIYLYQLNLCFTFKLDSTLLCGV